MNKFQKTLLSECTIFPWNTIKTVKIIHGQEFLQHIKDLEMETCFVSASSNKS